MVKPCKILGFGVCGPNEKRLESTLKEFKRLCDHTVIVGNNIDQKSRDLIAQYGFTLWEDNREWGTYQNKIKEASVRRLEAYSPMWVITLDMDEVFDSSFTREEAEKLCDKGGIGYFFYIVNLYETGYSKEWSFWNNRMFKYQEPLTFANKALHCGLAPELHWKNSNYAPFILKHYGLKDKEDRDRKAKRYEKFDPNAKHCSREYYDFLTSKSPVSEFNELELHKEVENEVKDYKFKSKIINMTEDKKFFYVKNPAGVILDIPDYQLQETLSRPGFSLISETPIGVKKGVVESTVAEVPKPVVEEENPMECKVCGFIAKNKLGFNAHQRKHK